MNITYAKIKKNSRSRFFKPQPARASLNENKMFMGLIAPLSNMSNICQIINQTFFFTNNLVKSKIQK